MERAASLLPLPTACCACWARQAQRPATPNSEESALAPLKTEQNDAARTTTVALAAAAQNGTSEVLAGSGTRLCVGRFAPRREPGLWEIQAATDIGSRRLGQHGR